ncbi:MAG: hypothetical protein AAF965_05755 [Pseudomonadota bacterium]
MQVVLHAGAHFTDDNRLIDCLLRNGESLAAEGTYAPEARAFRRVLRGTVHNALSHGLTDDGIAAVHESLALDETVTRLILSNASFFGTPKMAVGQGLFYPGAEDRLAVFHDIFSDGNLELFLGLRNPATYLPALFATVPNRDMDAFLSGFDPEDFRWSETIARFRSCFPDMPITLWCNEDSPLIWGQILREMASLAPNAVIEGEFGLLKEIMTDKGWARFDRFIDRRPNLSEAQKRRVVQAFLEAFVKVDEIEEELDLPGWDEARIDALTESYDEDIEAIARLPNVTLLTP